MKKFHPIRILCYLVMVIVSNSVAIETTDDHSNSVDFLSMHALGSMHGGRYHGYE